MSSNPPLRARLSSVSSGVTTHSCDINVLSRQSFVLHQPTVRLLPEARLSARTFAGRGAACFNTAGGSEDSNCVDKDTFLHFPCTLGFNWLWKMEDSVITEMDYLSVPCPWSICPQRIRSFGGGQSVCYRLRDQIKRPWSYIQKHNKICLVSYKEKHKLHLQVLFSLVGNLTNIFTFHRYSVHIFGFTSS